MKPIGKYIVIDEIKEEISTESGILLTTEDTKDLRYKKGVVVMPGTDVAVVNTTINNTPIGATTASTGAFTSGTVANQPTTANGISNKKYVDNTSTALAIALGV